VEITQTSILEMYSEWMDKLERAIAESLGEEQCEATRMVLGIGSVMHAYFEGAWQPERAQRAYRAFKEALRVTTTVLETGEYAPVETDQYSPEELKERYEWFTDNIASRLDNLQHSLDVNWCPGWRN